MFLAMTCFVAVYSELSAQEIKPTPATALLPDFQYMERWRLSQTASVTSTVFAVGRLDLRSFRR